MTSNISKSDRERIVEFIPELRQLISSASGVNDDYIQQIESILNIEYLSTHIFDLMKEALRIVRVLKEKPSAGFNVIFGETIEGANSVVKKLNDLEGEFDIPQYMYHGTIRRHLKSILDFGLVPGGIYSKTWKGANLDSIREYSDGGVFLCGAWRGAESWATIAHAKSRGPKAGVARQPIILRIPKAAIKAFEEDSVASARNTLVSRDRIRADKMSVMMWPFLGPPRWIAIQDAVKIKDKPACYPDL